MEKIVWFLIYLFWKLFYHSDSQAKRRLFFGQWGLKEPGQWKIELSVMSHQIHSWIWCKQDGERSTKLHSSDAESWPNFIFSSIYKNFYFSLYHFLLIWNEIFESISQSANQSVCREMVLCPCSRNRCINNSSGGDRNCSSSNILTLLECLLYARNHFNPFYSYNHPMIYDMINYPFSRWRTLGIRGEVVCPRSQSY